MPVNTLHEQYVDYLPYWIIIRDVLAGEKAVKAKGEKYLPMPSGMRGADASWLSYLARASFPAIINRYLIGTVGLFLRKDFEIEVDDNLNTFIDKATDDGKNFNEIVRQSIYEILSVSRYGILVDMPETNKISQTPVLIGYIAENIINWKTEKRNGINALTMVVLKELIEDWVTEFEVERKESYLVLYLDDQNIYRTKRFAQKSLKDDKDIFYLVEENTPTINGKVLNFIPFQFFNADSLTPEIGKPFIIDMINLVLSLYRNSADLEQALHLVGQPTLVLTGIDSTTPIFWGSATALVLPTGSEAKLVEIQGQGLVSIRQSMDAKRKEIASIGAWFLEQDNIVNVSILNEKIKQNNNTIILQSIIRIISSGFEQVLKWAAQWQNIPYDDIKFKINSDFIPESMNPDMLRELVAALQAGTISYDTFVNQLQEGELMPVGVTATEEQQKISTDLSTRTTTETLFSAISLASSKTLRTALEIKLAKLLLPESATIADQMAADMALADTARQRASALATANF